MINAILEGKKATGSQGSFTNKTVWTCFYACSLCTIFFFFFLEFTIVFVTLIEIKIKIY